MGQSIFKLSHFHGNFMETGSATDVMLCSLADDQRQLEKRATNTGMHFELLQITYSLKKTLC